MGDEVSRPAREREARKLAAGVAVLWTVIGIAAALTVPSFGTFGGTDQVRIAIAACGMVVGCATAFALYHFARDDDGTTALLLGHLAALPPALRVGLASADLAAREAGLQWPATALPVYCVVLCALTAAAALIGSKTAVSIADMLGSLIRGVFVALRREPPPRVPWRAVRLTVLVAALGVALHHGAQKLGYLPPTDDVPKSSAWIEREKTLFFDIVGAHPVDAVVLPVQAASRTFDRAERSLMTRYLARRLERSGLKVADPTFVARALDVRARRVDLAEAKALAERAGARLLVESQVSRRGDRLDFESALWRRTGDAWERGTITALRDLSWSDARPASLAVLDSIDAVAANLGLEAAKPVESEPPAAPPPFADLAAFTASGHGSVEQRALALQLLAALHQRESVEGDALWERSLVAIADAAPGAMRKVVEVRAYLHLCRRPAALALLAEPQGDEERFLAALLNGDIPSAESAIEKIGEPWQRLVAEIELADLYHAFGFDARTAQRRRAVMANLRGTVAVAAGFRMAHADWFNPEIHDFVAAQLPREIPLVDVLWGAAEAAYPWLAWLYWRGDPHVAAEVRPARLVEQGRPTLWRKQRAHWSAARGADRPAPWDYYDLLYSLNERAVLKAVHSTLFMQGQPEKAVRLSEALQRGPLADHPQLTLYHASALDRAGRRLDPYQAQPMFTRSSALALAAYRWEGGESRLSWAAEHLTFGRPYEKYADEPLRWYRSRDVAPDRESFERLRFSAREMEGFVADDRRRLLYSDREPGPLKDLVGWLRRSGRADAAAAELEAHRHRFVGAALTAEMLAEAEEARRTGDPRPYFRKLLEIDPESWSARWRLAALHVESGAASEAQALLLAYPPFQDHARQPDPVRLSNIAFEAANFLHRSGEPQLALPLFKLSADMQTGSNRWMQSREALALSGDDIAGAMNFARMQVQRYENPRAGMRLVAYHALLGRTSDVDAMLGDFLNRFDDEATWTAAFLAHRMRGMDAAAAETWLTRAAQASGRKTYFNNALRERHAFMLALLDRAPGAAAVAQVQRVTRANNGSPFYVNLAEGYVAMHAGQHALAAAKFRRPFDDLFAISVNRGTPLADVLPYLVYSYARAGNGAEAEKLLADYRSLIGIDADYLMARALLDGRSGDHEAADASLRRAFFRLPELGTRTFFSGYVLLEACELLLKETGEPRYRRLMVDFARRLQLHFPYPWAAAIEAQYAGDAQDREAALASAQILDPASPRIAGIPRLGDAAVRAAAAKNAGLLGAVARAGGR